MNERIPIFEALTGPNAFEETCKFMGLPQSKPRKAEPRDPHEAILDAQDMASEQVRVGGWTTCAICGVISGDLDKDFICPDCQSDFVADETEKHNDKP